MMNKNIVSFAANVEPIVFPEIKIEDMTFDHLDTKIKEQLEQLEQEVLTDNVTIDDETLKKEYKELEAVDELLSQYFKYQNSGVVKDCLVCGQKGELYKKSRKCAPCYRLYTKKQYIAKKSKKINGSLASLIEQSQKPSELVLNLRR
jgi:predicted ATP-dependent endonuclease of OLD family